MKSCRIHGEPLKMKTKSISSYSSLQKHIHCLCVTLIFMKLEPSIQAGIMIWTAIWQRPLTNVSPVPYKQLFENNH